MAQERAAVRGSARQGIPNASPVGFPNPYERVDVSIYLRRRSDDLPKPGRTVTREEFESRYGADPADVARVEQFAAEFDLTVVEIDLARRVVMLNGTIANINEAFATE